MAYLKPPKSKDEVAKLGLSALRKAYLELADNYMKILDGDVLYDHYYNDFYSVKESTFYTDKRFKSGYFPLCKKVVLDMATDFDKKTGERKDNKEKTQWVLHLMDLPYLDDIFEAQMQNAADDVGEKVRTTAFQQYVTLIKSLPQYKKLTWKDSKFGAEGDTTANDDDEVKRKARKEIKKIFGSGFSEADYLYLQDQYDDWRARTQVNTKSQETVVVQICFKQLEIWKAQRAGNDTDKMIKSLNDLMNAGNLQPRQAVGNAETDQMCLGQMIEKFENERPIPEPDPEFKDPSKIGTYIRVWFSGWLSKALGFKNGYTQECEDYIKNFEVKSVNEVEDGESEDIYSALFGNSGD